MAEADDTARWKASPAKPSECGRCGWIRSGKKGDEVDTHDASCPFRDTGTDPAGDSSTNDGL